MINSPLYRIDVIDASGAMRCQLVFGSRQEAELVLDRWTRRILDQATVHSFEQEPWILHVGATAS